MAKDTPFIPDRIRPWAFCPYCKKPTYLSEAVFTLECGGEPVQYVCHECADQAKTDAEIQGWTIARWPRLTRSRKND